MLYKSIPIIDKYYDPVNTHVKPNFKFTRSPMVDWNDQKAANSKMKCHCCETERSQKWFPEALDPTWSRPDPSGKSMRSFYCIPCLSAMWASFSNLPGQTIYSALYRICMLINCYYDDEFAHKVREDKTRQYADGRTVDARLTFPELYLRAVAANPKLSAMTFFDSDNFAFRAAVEKTCNPDRLAEEQNKIKIMQQELAELKKEKELNAWDQLPVDDISELTGKKTREQFNKELKEKIDELKDSITADLEPKIRAEVEEKVRAEYAAELSDRQVEFTENATGLTKTQGEKSAESDFLSPQSKEARNQVLLSFHKDPFVNESLEDKESMYIDLATMIDDAMSDDLLRQKSAVEVVRIFNRIDKLSEAIRELQSTPQSIIDSAASLKTLSEQKASELRSVTQLAKDHGFAERYATNKAKGSGTLSAIIREASESDFDPLIIDKYDIETADAIKQVSDISARSIINQIGLTDSEFAAMVKEQAETIREMKAENTRIKEELRLVRKSIAKAEVIENLKEDLVKKKIPVAEINEIVKEEWRR